LTFHLERTECRGDFIGLELVLQLLPTIKIVAYSNRMLTTIFRNEATSSYIILQHKPKGIKSSLLQSDGNSFIYNISNLGKIADV